MEKGIDLGLVYLFVIATASVVVIAGGFIGMVILYQRRQLSNLKEKQDLEDLHQKGLLKSFIETQEKERKRIAAELHDGIGASLAACKMQLSQLKMPDQSSSERLKEGIELILHTAENARRISHNLMPPTLETLGLERTMERFIESSLAGKISCDFQYDTRLLLEASDALNFYRIGQELISNTLKHSQSTAITMCFELNSGDLRFYYKDNGKGASSSKQIGLGLQNIESRVQAVGGSMTLLANEEGWGIEIIQKKHGKN